jgi:hypothetical protein
MPKISDEDRRQWVENDEGLHNEWKRSKQPQRSWIRMNRKMIDGVIGNVQSGAKPPHYLAYPQPPKGGPKQ